MKTSILLSSLLAICFTSLLRADRVENAKQLSDLQALSFSTVRKVSVAKLSTPLKKEDASFHGCVLQSKWKEIPVSESQALVGVLRELIADHISFYSKAGDADVISLQPFGFAYGEFAIRLETDRGRREFSVSPRTKTGYVYVYAYDEKKHSRCFTVDGALQQKLSQSLPNQPVQHNAGSRPSSGDSPVSETPSSLGPRG